MSNPDRAYLYKRTEQAPLYLYVYLPPEWEASDRRPAIVFFFGGGWVGGTVQQFAPQATHLAQRGMVAICAEYRVRSRHNVTAESCVADARSALAWVHSHAGELGIDPARIVAAGGSAGGHIAACAAMIDTLEDDPSLTASSKPCALVLFNPVLEISKERQEMVSRFASPASAERLSPIRWIRPGLPPTLIIHGTADTVVPISQARAFVQEMSAQGNTAILYEAPNQAHGFFNRSPWRERTLAQVERFLEQQGLLS